MNAKQWDTFFTLLGSIVNGEGSWKERAAAVSREASAREATANLEEFAGWFEMDPETSESV